MTEVIDDSRIPKINTCLGYIGRMLFAIWYRVLQSRGAMPRTQTLLLNSADLTLVAMASELRGQGGEIEPKLAFQSECREYEGIRRSTTHSG